MMTKGDIKKMLNPETIALIGATEKEGSIGRTLLENLYYWSKERKIFPVNPNRKTVLGLDCYPDILSVPKHVDLCVIATPAPTVPEVVEACGKAAGAGMRLSAIILLGLGGVDGSHAHAKDSARVVNAIDPPFLAALTLMLGPYERVYEEEIMGGGFRVIDRMQSLQELRWFVEDLALSDCKFGTEHASNYLPIRGMKLPGDKERILALIDEALKGASRGKLRPEWARGL